MISTSGLLYALTLVTTLGCGTIAGVFFALAPSDDQNLAVLRAEAIIRQRALQKMTIRAKAMRRLENT